MPPAISRTSAEPTLYEILALTPKRLEGQAPTAQQKIVKQAYHKALLKHHPDKNPQDSPAVTSPNKAGSNQPRSSNGKPSPSSSSSSIPKSQIIYTVDQIQHAYSVLSDACQRREYDRQLLTTNTTTFSSSYSATEQRHSVSTRFHTGVETVDLDDLGFDERTGVYFGPCRCGNARGFQFTEDQLEEYEDDLVLMVQCLDCSLWMRVLFDAADDSADEQPSQTQPQPQPQAQVQPQMMRTNISPGRFATVATNILSGNLNQNQTQNRMTERRGSQSISRSGKGWTFNVSFDWGISLAGSGSVTTTTTTRSVSSSNART